MNISVSVLPHEVKTVFALAGEWLSEGFYIIGPSYLAPFLEFGMELPYSCHVRNMPSEFLARRRRPVGYGIKPEVVPFFCCAIGEHSQRSHTLAIAHNFIIFEQPLQGLLA